MGGLRSPKLPDSRTRLLTHILMRSLRQNGKLVGTLAPSDVRNICADKSWRMLSSQWRTSLKKQGSRATDGCATLTMNQ